MRPGWRRWPGLASDGGASALPKSRPTKSAGFACARRPKKTDRRITPPVRFSLPRSIVIAVLLRLFARNPDFQFRQLPQFDIPEPGEHRMIGNRLADLGVMAQMF
jgi:hypothetical protein